MHIVTRMLRQAATAAWNDNALRRPEKSEPWTVIFSPAVSIVVEMQPLVDVAAVEATLALAVDERLILKTTVFNSSVFSPDLARLPAAVRLDISENAYRFAALMSTESVKIRLECVTTDACRYFHADQVGLRLVKTYAGPGTDYIFPGCGPERSSRLPTGAVGLFKGSIFPGVGHQPCLHRSPPISGLRVRRLVLAIDCGEALS